MRAIDELDFDSRMSALQVASYHSHLKIVKILIDTDTKLNAAPKKINVLMLFNSL